MASIFLHGKGKRDDNLDRISLVAAFGKTYLIMIDAYDSNSSDVDKYTENLRHKLIETGDIYLSILETCPQGVKASLILSEISTDTLRFISIGDCRLYFNGCLITRDGSVAWDLLSKKGKPNNIIPDLVCNHPRRNILTQFVSEKNYRKILLPPSSFSIQAGDELIFSTDGFWEIMHESIKNFELDSYFSYICRNESVFDDNYSMIYLCV